MAAFYFEHAFESDIRSFAKDSKKPVTKGMDVAGILAICVTGRKVTLLKLVARASRGRFNKRVVKALLENLFS